MPPPHDSSTPVLSGDHPSPTTSTPLPPFHTKPSSSFTPTVSSVQKPLVFDPSLSKPKPLIVNPQRTSYPSSLALTSAPL